MREVITLTWLYENWSLLVVIAAVAIIAASWLKKFTALPSEEQLNKVREWLLFAVIMAEKEYQSGTGQLKLRATYNDFLVKFPTLVTVIPFELFSQLVDEALDKMRKLLESNMDIRAYVEGLNE